MPPHQGRRSTMRLLGGIPSNFLIVLAVAFMAVYLSRKQIGGQVSQSSLTVNVAEAAPVESKVNAEVSPSRSALPQLSRNESKQENNLLRAKTFIVLFMGHSGSTAFITELRAHSEFEIEKLEPLDHGEYEHDTDLALKYAREIFDGGISRGKIPGFKLRPLHILKNPDAWNSLFKEYNTRIIWQFRENLFKMAIGEYRHRVLNDTSVVEGLHLAQKPCQDESQQCKFDIKNMEMLYFLLNDFSRSDEMLLDAARLVGKNGNMMTAKYEDYLYRRDEQMKETFEFLGVGHENTAPQRIKASPDSLCDMVTNFQEVCQMFYPCQFWRIFLDDAVNGCRCRLRKWDKFDRKYCDRETSYSGKE